MAIVLTRKEDANKVNNIIVSNDIACNMSSLLSPIADLLQTSNIDDNDLDKADKAFCEVERALSSFREVLRELIEKHC